MHLAPPFKDSYLLIYAPARIRWLVGIFILFLFRNILFMIGHTILYSLRNFIILVKLFEILIFVTGFRVYSKLLKHSLALNCV